MTRRAGAAGAAIISMVVLWGSPAWAAGGGVKSVSSPPSKPSRHFVLRVGGSASQVTLYVTLFRHQKRGRVLLGTFKVRHHKVTVTLPRRLPASAYFIVACPSAGGGSCVSSKKPAVVLPSASSVLHSGSATAASTGAASGVIGEAGGTLQASSPAASMTLQVPARSLPNDNLTQCTFQQQFGFWRRTCPASGAAFAGETITLTPLASLSAGSLGRFVTGAQLGPDGLSLIHGATLTFSLRRAVPAAQLVAVQYSGTGASMHVVPFRSSGGRVAVALAEVGGGVALLRRAGGAASDLGARSVPNDATGLPPAPDGVSPFYSQLIGGELQVLRESGHDLGDHSQQSDDAESAIASTLAEWKQDILDNEVKAGMGDDAAAVVAIRDLLLEERDAALFGMGNGDIPPEVLKLLSGIYNRAQQRCHDAPGFSVASIREIIGAARDLMLAGASEIPMDQLLTCMQFKLTFDSTITTTFGGSDHGTHINEYLVNMSLKPSADATALTGQGPGAYAQASGHMYQDPQDCGDGSGPFVSNMDDLSGSGVTAQVPTFTLPSARIGGPAPQLELLLGQPTETYHLYDTGGSNCKGDTNRALPLWFGNFLEAHRGEVDGTLASPGSYIFTLNPGTGQTIETRSYDQTYASGQNTETEHTTITIVHTPGAVGKL